MKLIGLTGSIGMGKSTTAAMFAAEGIPVWDADAAVHQLYAPDGAAVAPILQAFPYVSDGAGGIDRTRLGACVTGDPTALARLEAIVHPLVGAHRHQWLLDRQAEGAGIVLLDVPLLFETGAESGMDVVVVASCPPELQRARVLARPGMSDEKFAAILARQTPDAHKRARADYIVETGAGLDHAREQVRAIVEELQAAVGRPDHARDRL
jgi:dephospho-CoA kinase